MAKSVRLSVCLSIASGADWLNAWFAGVLPYVDEVVVVLGAARDWVDRGNAHPDGSSLDGTEETVWWWKRRAPRKIAVIGPQAWPTRNAQRQAYLDHAAGDVIIPLDADEFVHPAAFGDVRQAFASNARLLMLAFPFRQYHTWHRWLPAPYAERAYRRIPNLSYPVDLVAGQWVLLDGQKLWRDAKPAPESCLVHHFNRVADRAVLQPRMDYYSQRDGGDATPEDLMALGKYGGTVAESAEFPPCVGLLNRERIGREAWMADRRKACETV